MVLVNHLILGMLEAATQRTCHPSQTLTVPLHGCSIAQPPSWWPSCAHDPLDPPATLSQHPINHHVFFPGENGGRGGARFLAGAEGSFPAGSGGFCRLSHSCRAHVDHRGSGHEVGGQMSGVGESWVASSPNSTCVPQRVLVLGYSRTQCTAHRPDP